MGFLENFILWKHQFVYFISAISTEKYLLQFSVYVILLLAIYYNIQ